MDDLEKGFHFIREQYNRQDVELITKKGSRVFDTSHGIFGISDLEVLFDLFKQIDLKDTVIVDLGSGDGRIVLLGALFTDAVGFEADESLHKMAVDTQEALQKNLPILKRCVLKNIDYTTVQLPKNAVFFTYADHHWPTEFEKRLQEAGGTLYSYQHIFHPRTLKKGKTFWLGQTPIVSYPLGT